MVCGVCRNSGTPGSRRHRVPVGDAGLLRNSSGDGGTVGEERQRDAVDRPIFFRWEAEFGERASLSRDRL